MQETWVWSPGERNGFPLQYSCLENSKDNPWGCKHLDMTEWLTLSLFYKFCNMGCGWFPAPFLDPGSLNKESIVPITFRVTSRSSRSRWILGRKHRFTTPRDQKSERLTVCKSHLVTAGPGAPRAHCQRCCRTPHLSPGTAPGGRYHHSCSYHVLSRSVVSDPLRPQGL